ncbi:hypothetical protein [uncultured Bacteroides sp.]|uniref:hypothetical protein n=1 Tax=uncultured Bacteroides sp. TaxID=162156 RepID=UPI0026224D07|nr:hypothetical protein [uncultured Bacteroides sp.]
MKITIHRGTDQIGGSVTEINHNGHRLFIDFGKQLPGAKSTGQLSIEGLNTGDTSKSALLLTHYHQDHVGKILETPDSLETYMGETAKEIYTLYEKRLSYIPDEEIASKHREIVNRLSRLKTFHIGQETEIQTFKVTPLMTDHSAFDSYMFVIEADGIRILHTGDFRGHGFRSKALFRMLHKYAQNIDYVISEGTNIARPNAVMESESKLQHRFIEEFRKHKYNFVITSSTNIDRVFSLCHAAKDTGRLVVCDNFQDRLIKTVEKAHKQFTTFYKTQKIYPIKRNLGRKFYIGDKLFKCMLNIGFCMLIRDNDAFWELISRFDKYKDQQAVYLSMWNGYVNPESSAYNQSLAEHLSRYPDYKYMHTSGHCDTTTMKEVFEKVRPKKGIIPIHTEHPEMFEKLYGNITKIYHLHDGETLDCGL